MVKIGGRRQWLLTCTRRRPRLCFLAAMRESVGPAGDGSNRGPRRRTNTVAFHRSAAHRADGRRFSPRPPLRRSSTVIQRCANLDQGAAQLSHRVESAVDLLSQVADGDCETVEGAEHVFDQQAHVSAHPITSPYSQAPSEIAKQTAETAQAIRATRLHLSARAASRSALLLLGSSGM